MVCGSSSAIGNKASDQLRPNTIVTTTRNISGPINGEDSLSDQITNPGTVEATQFAIWKGAANSAPPTAAPANPTTPTSRTKSSPTTENSAATTKAPPPA